MTTTTKQDTDDLMHEVQLMRVQLETVLAERDQLRTEVGQLRQAVRVSTGKEAAPVVQVQPRKNQLAWEDQFPAHDPGYVEAMTRYGTQSPQARKHTGPRKTGSGTCRRLGRA